MTIVSHFRKYFLAYSFLFVAIGVMIDSFFNVAELQKKVETIKDLTGNSITYDIYVFSIKYKILSILSNLCYGIGIAILVYFGIEYKVDSIERQNEKLEKDNYKQEIKNLNDQINTNIFDGVLKKLIPEKLFDVLARDVLNRNIIRKNARWVYDIIETTNGYDLTQVIEYELQNIGNTSEMHTIKIGVYHSSNVSQYFQYFKIVKDSTTFVELDAATLKTSQTNIQTGIINEQKVELRPKEVIKVQHSIVNVYSTKFIQDAHYSNYSILNLNIQVHKPENCEFNIYPTFSEKLIPSVPAPTKIFYNEISGILVGQCVIFTIEKK